MSKDIDDILSSLRHLVQSLRQFSHRVEREKGITGAQLFVLGQLRENPSLTMSRLAELTHTHPSSVTAVVARLLARRLVSKQASRRDARQLEVRLTAAGVRVLDEADATPQDRLIHALSSLPLEERATLARILTRVVYEAGFADVPAAMFFEETLAKEEESCDESGVKAPAPSTPTR